MPEISGPPPGDAGGPDRGRIMVLIGNDPGATRLVEVGRALADRSGAYWVVAHVTPAEISARLPPGPLQEAIALAERKGADVVALTGQDLVSEVLAFAGEYRLDQIIVGRSRRPWRWLKLRPSLSSALVSKARGPVITVITERAPRGYAPHLVNSGGFRYLRRELPGLFAGLAAIVLAAGLCWLLAHSLSTPNLSLVFLVAVLVIAVRYGRVPALLTAILSFLTFNFFFTEPVHTLYVSSRADVLTITFFLVVALIAGHFGARVRRQILIVRDNSRLNALLYDFSRRLNAVTGEADIVRMLRECLSESAGMDSTVLLNRGDGLMAASEGAMAVLTPEEWRAAEVTFENNDEPAAGTEHSAAGSWYFIPMRSATENIGVLALCTGQGATLSPLIRRLVFALRDQATIALEKQRLADEVARTELEAEAERLRAALLSSVSHDLRTPLVSIIGAASTLLELGPRIDSESSRQLLSELLKEAERLNRFVQNLLDMTRLGYGALKAEMQWHDVRDIIAGAMRGLGGVLKDVRVETVLSGDPMIYTDAVLARQILLNLLDNAAKYAPAESDVRILLNHDPQSRVFRLAVEDRGPGVAEAEREHIFDLFYRVRKGDRQLAGTGLGLAIWRDFVSALGGHIRVAEAGGGTGARFELELPQPPVPEKVQE